MHILYSDTTKPPTNQPPQRNPSEPLEYMKIMILQFIQNTFSII